MSVVVVIDPGHGGENSGGNTEEFIEKDLTIKVANYMRERLQQYEGVEVYLTHEDSTSPDLGRDERAEIAKAHNADFMFSIHFNLSADHTLYGSEVWTSAYGEYYKVGQEFANIEMEALTGLGFFDRGVKTRLGKDGDDYYGAILQPKKLGIPAVIIEHCHMDEDRDADYLRSHGEEAYRTFGYLDADCVAKYFHLKSSTLGVDYTNYSYPTVPLPTTVMGPDLTPADEVTVEMVEPDTGDGTAKIRITAKDAESKMLYYRLSYDGGTTFGKVWPWNEDKEALKPTDSDSITVDVDLAEKEPRDLVVKVYNRLDRKADSNVLTLPAKAEKKAEETELSEEESINTDEAGSTEMTDVSFETTDTADINADTHAGRADAAEAYTEVDVTLPENKKSDSGVLIFVIAGSIMILAVGILGYFVYMTGQRKRRRRKRRK